MDATKSTATTIMSKYLTRLNLIFFFTIFIYSVYMFYCSNNVEYDLNFKSNSINNTKYLIYSCDSTCSGYADRVKGMLTAYAISLLTNRKFIIQNKMTRNCLLETFQLPNEINWLNKQQIKKLSKHQIPDDFNGDLENNNFIRRNFIEYHNTTDILYIRTGMNLIKHLTINNKHHSKIKQLGYSLDNFNIESQLYDWYFKLFKLNSELQSKYDTLVKQMKPNNITKLICAQIRIGEAGNFKFMERKDTKLYWNFMRTKFINNLNFDYKIFITSDHSDVIAEAYNEFGNDKVIGFMNHSFHMNHLRRTNKKCNDIGDLILEFNLLANCDYAVVSHSGFGILGVINRKIKNFNNIYVYTNPNEIKSKFWNRNNLSFYSLDKSFLYLEFN